MNIAVTSVSAPENDYTIMAVVYDGGIKLSPLFPLTLTISHSPLAPTILHFPLTS